MYPLPASYRRLVVGYGESKASQHLTPNDDSDSEVLFDINRDNVADIPDIAGYSLAPEDVFRGTCKDDSC